MQACISRVRLDLLEKRFSTTPVQGAISYGDVVRIADGTRYHLRSAHQILSALFPDQQQFLSGLDQILERLEFGLPSKALSLTKLSVPLTRGQYLALANSGIFTAADINALSEERLRAFVGPIAAAQLRPSPPGGSA
jgi:helicase